MIYYPAPDGNLFEVELAADGKKDLLFAGLGRRFRVFQLHGETVELKPGMKLLGAGKTCRNQVVKVGDNAYGFQCHLELTIEMLERWLRYEFYLFFTAIFCMIYPL